MRKVQLITKAGGFVAFVEIVPFPDAGMPDVVAWGDRLFARFAPHPDDARVWTYTEVFAVVSFTPSPGLPE